MNRKQRRATRPTSSEPVVWDLVLADVSDAAFPKPIAGLLLVCERDLPRDVFQVAPGAGLGQYVRRAANISTYGQPARLPDRIRCADPALAARLRADLTDLGVRVDVVASLPAAEALADFMRAELDSGPAPGPDGDLPRWREVTAELARVAPWNDLDPSVAFGIDDGPLAGSLVVVHRGPDNRAVIVLFRSRHDWQDYSRAIQLGSPPRYSGTAMCIVPASDLPPEEARRCRELGLALPDGRVPFLTARDAGVTRGVTLPEERRLLAAAEVVLAGCAAGFDRGALLTPLPAAPTVLGPQGATFLGFPPDLVVLEQHLCVYIGLPRPDGTAPTGIVLQLTPADARRVATQLRGADSAVLREMHGDVGVVAYRGGVEIGLVAVVPRDLAHTVEDAAATGRLDLAVSRAGVDEPSTRSADLVLTLPLRVSTGPEWRVQRAKAEAPTFAG